jgi:hypothetical protein
MNWGKVVTRHGTQLITPEHDHRPMLAVCVVSPGSSWATKPSLPLSNQWVQIQFGNVGGFKLMYFNSQPLRL